MKIALLGGALKNAGDFLITKRSEELIRIIDPKIEIEHFLRNNKLTEEELGEINKKDLIVIAGGPCYTKEMYPKILPLVEELDDIKPKIGMMGCGWYENTIDNSIIREYKFTASSLQLLKRVEKDTKFLGCRDSYSVRVLASNGFLNGIMTGCPAWYDINQISNRISGREEIKKIAISDPADAIAYADQSIKIVEYLRKRYPEAEIHYFFHRGIESDKHTVSILAKCNIRTKLKLEEIGVVIHDIAYGYEGFMEYNKFDLHIGHRVHAHIYNLSQRKKSILIEEDSRGAGINDILGLWNLRAYERKKNIPHTLLGRIKNKIYNYVNVNRSIISELETYLDYLEYSQYGLLNEAFSRMERYYTDMHRYLVKILSKG